MKTALAIVCSLLLAWTQFVPAAMAAGDTCEPDACCCDCSQASCCAARPSSEPQPVSAAPLPATFQNQFLPAPAVLAWTLPGAAPGEVAAFISSTWITADAPLYARDCARLI